MPAIMKAATKDILDRYKHRSAIAPLLIRFKCVFVPIGCFTAMIAQLVCDRTKNNWELSDKDNILYKDVVTFTLPGSFKAILICRPKRYEIHLSPLPNREDTRPVEEIASTACKPVCGALNSVLDKLRDQYTTPDLTIYSLAFFCGCKGLHEDRDDRQQHLMLVNTDNERLASCIENKREMKLKPAHLVWNGSHKFGSKFFIDEVSGHALSYRIFGIINMCVSFVLFCH